jgi:predicted Holliday junction resolvase-like endonuclease
MLELLLGASFIIVIMYAYIQRLRNQNKELREELDVAYIQVNQERHIAERLETRDKRVEEKVQEVENEDFDSLFDDPKSN